MTNLDADYYGSTVDELAERWQKLLYEALSQELEERSPESLEKKIERARFISLGTIAISLLLWLTHRLAVKRDQTLKAKQMAQTIATAPVEATDSKLELPSEQATVPPASVPPAAALDQTVYSTRRQFNLKRRRKLLAAAKWLLGLGQLAVWLIGVAIVLSLFPETKHIGADLLDVPIRLVAIWFAASAVNWVGDLLVDRLSRAWEDDQFSAFLFAEDAQRKTLRISTTIKALRGLKTFLVYCFGIGWALQTLGVPIASVLAGGAIVAFAITLAFQNLAKDLINGCLILWEDQYGIGDVVSINSSTGLVENMSLRATQLRDGEGRLITIPNSSITKVENLTRTWSRVNFEIEVACTTDIDEVLTTIAHVSEMMYSEPEWNELMVEPPEVLGIDRLSAAGTQIRVWIKTKPSQQWKVGREFRRRVWRCLSEHGIAIGMPQPTHAEIATLTPADGQVLSYSNSDRGTAPTPQPSDRP